MCLPGASVIHLVRLVLRPTAQKGPPAAGLVSSPPVLPLPFSSSLAHCQMPDAIILPAPGNKKTAKMTTNVLLLKEVAMASSDIEQDSPEEGEIRDDSSDESYSKSMAPENAIVRSNRPVVLPQHLTKPTISKRSSRAKVYSGDPPILQKPVGHADLRNEKENQLSIKIVRHIHNNHKNERRRGLASPEEGVREKMVEKVHTKRKKVATQHKNPRHVSENRKQGVHNSTYVARRKSKQEENEIVVLSDSDIEEQIQKTRKRLKNDNFAIEKLKHATKSSSTETVSVSSTDWQDLSKSTSSLEIIDVIPSSTVRRQSKTVNVPQNVDSRDFSELHVKDKSTPSNTQDVIPSIKKINSIQHKGSSSNSSISPPKVKKKSKEAIPKIQQEEIDQEELNLRVVALKSVIETKYGKKAKGKQQSSRQESNDETEPVDMDLSLTDDEKEYEIPMVMVSNQAFQQAECLLNSALVSSNDGAETDSTDTSNRYIVVDEVGFSSASQGDATGKQDTGAEEDDEELLRAQLLIALTTKQKPLPVEKPLKVDVTKVSVPKVSPSILDKKKTDSNATALKEKFDMQALIAKYGSKPGTTGFTPVKRSFANPYRISKAGNKLIRKDIYKSKKIQKVTAKNYKRPVKEMKHKFLSAAAMKRVTDTVSPRTVTSPVLPVGPPPTANRLVIQLGQDSDTDDESQSPTPQRDPVVNKPAMASNDLLKSVDQFLKQVRQNVEKSQQPDVKMANSSSPSLTLTSLEEKSVVAHKNVPKVAHMANISSDMPNKSPNKIPNSNPLSHQNSNNAPEESNIDEPLIQLYSSKKTPQTLMNEQNKSALKESDLDIPASDLRITLEKSSTGTWSTTAFTTKSTTLPQKNTEVTKKVIPKTLTPRSNKQDAKAGKITKSSGSTAANSSSLTSTKIATTPLAVRHLPSSQQMEYHLLKLEIARREELMKLKSRLGQPTTKSTATREVILHEQQPELKITVTNNVGGEDDDNVRTVRHSAPASVAEQVLQIPDKVNEVSDKNLEKLQNVDKDKETYEEEKIDKSITPKDNSKQSKLPATATNVTQTPKAGLAKKRLSSQSKGKSPASKRRMLPSVHGKQNMAELVKLPDDEKKLKKNMLEKLTLLASLLHDVDHSQAQIVDSEARVEALKKALSRAETKAEEERVALKKLFAQVPNQLPTLPYSFFFPPYQLLFSWQVGQVRVEVADTRTQCAGLAKVCQVLGPKTVGPSYQAPQEGMEQLRTHLQQVVELTKKTKLGLKTSTSSASSSFNHVQSPSPTISCENHSEAAKCTHSDMNVQSLVPNSSVAAKSQDENRTCDKSETEKAGSTETNVSATEDNISVETESCTTLQSELTSVNAKSDCSKSPQQQIETTNIEASTSSNICPSISSEKKEPEKNMSIRVKPLSSLLADPSSELSKGIFSQSIIAQSSSWLPDRCENPSDVASTLLHSGRAASYQPYISPLEHMKHWYLTTVIFISNVVPSGTTTSEYKAWCQIFIFHFISMFITFSLLCMH
ncbi:hypothetical protein B566_EDAN013567 [Ephemera danica]|nr:hypothetical protein B566_EDAN013567 [Ephemera danica]